MLETKIREIVQGFFIMTLYAMVSGIVGSLSLCLIAYVTKHFLTPEEVGSVFAWTMLAFYTVGRVDLAHAGEQDRGPGAYWATRIRFFGLFQNDIRKS